MAWLIVILSGNSSAKFWICGRSFLSKNSFNVSFTLSNINSGYYTTVTLFKLLTAKVILHWENVSHVFQWIHRESLGGSQDQTASGISPMLSFPLLWVASRSHPLPGQMVPGRWEKHSLYMHHCMMCYLPALQDRVVLLAQLILSPTVIEYFPGSRIPLPIYVRLQWCTWTVASSTSPFPAIKYCLLKHLEQVRPCKVNIWFLILLMHWKHMQRAVDFDIWCHTHHY